MRAIDKQLELTTAAILAADEGWAKGYFDQPKQFKQLIKNTAKLDREVAVYFHDLSKTIGKFIDWYAYARAVIEQRQNLKADASIQAYDVNVIVNQDGVAQQDQEFIKLVFDTVAATTALGADSMAESFKSPIGLTPTSTIIHQLTTKQLANLVGMRVMDKGKPTEHVIPNPNAAYNIDETTRGKIARSIQTSIQLGESQPEAVARLSNVIDDPARAEMIARTETVRAFAEGRAEYARQAGMGSKHWYDSNAIDECADNTAEGWIGLDEDFESGDPNEPAHPNCKCQVLYRTDAPDE